MDPSAPAGEQTPAPPDRQSQVQTWAATPHIGQGEQTTVFALKSSFRNGELGSMLSQPWSNSSCCFWNIQTSCYLSHLGQCHYFQCLLKRGVFKTSEVTLAPSS